MALTPAQQAVVKADIVANGDLNSLPNTLDGAFAIAALYNAEASPAFYVWRQDIPASEVANAINLQNLADITDTDSARCVRMFDIRSSNGGTFHGDRLSDRTAFADVFSAAAGDETETAIALLWYRKATRIEKLLALGNNPGTEPLAKNVAADAGPDDLGYVGPITFSEVFDARNS